MTTNTPENFYVTGGTLRRDTPSYVTRRADEDLYDGLRQGQFCYVLTSRQMGKSSLMVQTAARLREAGATVALLDLTRIGQNLTPEQWYDDLLGRLAEQVELEEELEEFWLAHGRLGPLSRWMRAVTEVVLPCRAGPVVIFVDEIDTVRSLPFSTDEFFAAIRELYNRRTAEPDLARLTFCLLGVATPSDLIRDTRTTPFNIGRRIELNDFTEAEAAPLARGLERDEATTAKLLGRILYWTGGHPYLTQRLCQAVADDPMVKDAGGLDRLCEDLFFSARARERDDNLLFVRERLLRSEADTAGLLVLYSQVRRQKRVRDDEANPLVGLLRLAGIARVVKGVLYVRNRIYSRVFDQEWVNGNMPDAELQRQQAAYRQGMLRTAVVATAIIFFIGSLAALAVNRSLLAVQVAKEADQERKRAQTEAHRADQTARELESALEEARKQQQQAQEETQRAEQALAEARKQQRIAEEQRSETKSQQQQVQQQRIIAENNEHNAWRMIQDSNDPASFIGYLEWFPNGIYVLQARRRWLELQKDRFPQASRYDISHNTGAFEGKVIDKISNLPIEGVIVRMTNEDVNVPLATRSDRAGIFYKGSLPPGIYRISFTREKYKQRTITQQLIPAKVSSVAHGPIVLELNE